MKLVILDQIHAARVTGELYCPVATVWRQHNESTCSWITAALSITASPRTALNLPHFSIISAKQRGDVKMVLLLSTTAHGVQASVTWCSVVKWQYHHINSVSTVIKSSLSPVQCHGTHRQNIYRPVSQLSALIVLAVQKKTNISFLWVLMHAAVYRLGYQCST